MTYQEIKKTREINKEKLVNHFKNNGIENEVKVSTTSNGRNNTCECFYIMVKESDFKKYKSIFYSAQNFGGDFFQYKTYGDSIMLEITIKDGWN